MTRTVPKNTTTARKPETSPAPAREVRPLDAELDSLLEGFAEQHRQLLAHTHAHRDALRKADGRGVQAAADAQTRVVGTLGALEQRRRELVAAACGRFAPLAPRRSVDVTLTDIARCMDEPRRSDLVRKAQDLKALVATAHEQTSTIKAATASLLAHMEGLMRQVGRQLSHAGTYSSRGFVEPGGVVVSALDIAT
jgi:hypothetical protein